MKHLQPGVNESNRKLLTGWLLMVGFKPSKKSTATHVTESHRQLHTRTASYTYLFLTKQSKTNATFFLALELLEVLKEVLQVLTDGQRQKLVT